MPRISSIPERLFGPDMIADPFPVYRLLRDESPVHWDPVMNAWVVTRYADVAMILGDQRFSSRRIAKGRERFPDPKFHALFDTLMGRMSEQDEPEHKRLRGLVQGAFARTAIDEWHDQIETTIDLLLNDAEQNSQFDFVESFAIPFPLKMILEIVGIPDANRRQVKSWCDDFSYVALNFYAGATEPDLRRAAKGVLEFKAFLKKNVETLRRSPGNDLLSSLIHAESEGARLTLEELLANTLLLLSAGNETTTCVLANGMHALLSQPEQFNRLRQDPSLIPNAIEEILRLEGPVQFLGRIASEDVVIGNQTIARDDLVLAVIASANRDREHFENPDHLDVARHPIPHLAFGHGHHFCAGSQLARMEITLAFEKILSRFPDIQLVSAQKPDYRKNANIRCVDKLQLQV